MQVVIGIVVVLLIVGSVIAIAWWNLSAKAAPYADEDSKQRAKREQARREEEANTVVISEFPRHPGAGKP